jgi:hypothetical protein
LVVFRHYCCLLHHDNFFLLVSPVIVIVALWPFIFVGLSRHCYCLLHHDLFFCCCLVRCVTGLYLLVSCYMILGVPRNCVIDLPFVL